MTHDYKRNGTTTLFAALGVLEGRVIGRCVPSHRHQEFIRFIAAVERSVPAGKVIHAILDNYAAHKHPEVMAWLADHPRWVIPHHADLVFLAERRPRLLLHAYPPGPQARRVSLGRGPRTGHRPLHHRGQQEPQALRLDRHSQGNQDQIRLEPSV
jgi:hypothetical protein